MGSTESAFQCVMLKLNIYSEMKKCRDSCDKHESLHLVD